ncbi:YebC/PmpR family DNA-binding transcriptional regulator [Candidatus Wolfebacteria bacterium]|nr:YebC/PmpR family DNA-binding transcriptional regulator [Candidatus Wolfebacteria bacterium]
MAGHSHSANVKHKKDANNQKKGKVFSKLVKLITIAAKAEPNPQFNLRLRTAIDKAKENQVPADNIERAIKRASEAGENLEELLMEAYGPEGAAILIEAITDSRNRTISEVKKILKDNDVKWADPGSVQWAFERGADGWQAKFPQEISEAGKEKLEELIEALEENDDVQNVITNVKN